MQGDDDTAHAATAMTGSGATQPATPKGDELSGRYELGRLLGKGGMGEVMSAQDDQIGRRVAIKRMRSAEPDAKSTARFLREAKIQGQLEHPSIVPVYELSTDPQGRPFFAMKQLAGATLNDLIGMALVEDPETLAKYPRQLLLRAFNEVCLAIEFAHTKQIIHRDLKPANVMLGDFGEVYVLDWGIAKVLGDSDDISAGPSGDDSHTLAGAMIGTPGYMSPEQIRGDADLDARADVYALGCILFEILAFEPLHPRGSKGIESAKAGIDARPSVRAPERDIPPELDAVCVAACQTDRAKRPLTARELNRMVQRYLDGDRDLAMRKDLATRELASAQLLLEGGLLETLSESRQRTLQRGPKRDELVPFSAAVRAAGRALALDPTSREAAELVSRLMLEPPVETPPDVSRKLVQHETDLMVSHARLGMWGLIGYLIFFPVMWLGGIREPWLVFGGTAVTFGIMAMLFVVTKRPTPLLIFLSFLGQVVLVALYSRGLSPLLVAPGVALITTLMYATHIRTGPIWLLWLCCAGGVLVPLAAEGFGIITATTSVVGSTLTIQLPAESLDQTVALVGLGGYVAVILFIATLLARMQAKDRRAIQRTVQLQAWQLEQLLPKAVA